MFATIASAVLDAPDAGAASLTTNGAGSTPSNHQIVNAAKTAYAQYRQAVDAVTFALVNTVKDPELSEVLSRLDGTNWQSAGVSATIVEPLCLSNELQSAFNVVRRTSSLSTYSVGVFATQLPGGASGPGMVGYAGSLPASATTGLTLDLDIFKSIVDIDNTQNLQYGLWLGAPAALHDRVYGFYANTTIQAVSVNLKILLTSALQPYGFVSSSGAGVPLNAGVFAGTTGQWRSA
jgi:hypothetical protein